MSFFRTSEPAQHCLTRNQASPIGPQLKFVPYHQLAETPNIIVDGPANSHTVLSLSHWVNSGTPIELKDDLSVSTVFRYLDRPEYHVDVPAVSNNHYDEDGLVSVYIMLNPQQAQQQRQLLIDIANAGDFGRFSLPEAARAVFVLSAFSDPQRSPLPKDLFALPYPDMCGRLYDELLPVLARLLKDPLQYAQWWQDEEQFLHKSEQAIANGTVTVESKPDLDLAIVRYPENFPNYECHQFAIHNATDCFRILIIDGSHSRFYYRYESWVDYTSRRPQPRIDLSELASQLSQLESAGAKWEFDGIQHTTPRLQLANHRQSTIAAETLVALVEQCLMPKPL